MSWNHISRKALTIDAVIAICLAGSALAQSTVYVDGSVATTGDGTQAAPFQTITEALALPGVTILVAGGTYAAETPFTDIRSDQTLIGGYDSSFTASDPLATPTIIDMGGRSQLDQMGTFDIQSATGWTLENLTIKDSTTGEYDDTENGGAIYIRGGSNGTLRGVTFLNCATKFEGGAETGPAREGGAVCIRDASTVVFEACVFNGCTAVGGGGAVRIRSAGAGNNVKFRRCLFTRCGARREASVIDDGDGVSQVEIVNCIFANNGVDVAIPSGIAPSNYLIRVSDRRALIYNCTFVGNNNPAGYMFNVGNSGDGAATKEIVNCIIANNTIASGGTTFALFNYATGYDDATTLQNNLFFSNSGLDPRDPAGATILGANGNIAGDPQFADAANGDYHLKAGSPGEDAGKTLTLVPNDFAGTARPVGAAYDIGAMEGQPKPPSYTVRSVVATASSSLNADSVPGKTVDRSGLNALDQHDTAAANMWTSAIGQQPPIWIQYEFDAVYKLDQMWVWNSNSDLEWLLGWGVKTATIEYSVDGTTWTVLANVPEFARAPGTTDYAHNTTVDFGGVAARCVRMTFTSSWGGGNQYGLSEVRFFYSPVSARDPNPPTGSKGVSIDTTLSWTAGQDAAEHRIYLSTDRQAVADGTATATTVQETHYSPADLVPSTPYFWRVDEVNDAKIPPVWPGTVWTFTTADFVVVDDFEAYNDQCNRVYYAWKSGAANGANADCGVSAYNGNGTGSGVGKDDPPYCERTIIHMGRQSMPMTYNGLSEATRTFDTAQDWTRGGVKTLVVFFQGVSTNGPGELYVKINATKVPYPGNTSDLTSSQWKQWNIDLPSGAGLGAVRTLTIGVSAGQGTLYIDDIRLYPSTPPVNP